jgi:hypothetical protein
MFMHIGTVCSTTGNNWEKKFLLRVKVMEGRPLFGRKKRSRPSPGSAGSSSDSDEHENLAEVPVIHISLQGQYYVRL